MLRTGGINFKLGEIIFHFEDTFSMGKQLSLSSHLNFEIKKVKRCMLTC